MRHVSWLVLLPLLGCGSCGSDANGDRVPVPTTTRPPDPPPPPDPCVAADAALAAWDAQSEVPIDELPAGAGGEPLGDAPIVQVADAVSLGEDSAGTIEEAVATIGSLAEDAFPEGAPVPLALRATDPVSRIVPLLRTFDEDTTFALVIVQTDRATGCRSVQQVPFAFKTDEDHGWVTFPTDRTVGDFLTALGGADTPRRVQLLE